jgi:hypothetical protein
VTRLLLPPDATTCLWQRASGAWELTAPSAPPPETTAFGPLWIATTDTDGVTQLHDRRVFAADTVVIHLRGDLPASPGMIAETLVFHDGLVLEDVIYRLSVNEGGSGGQTQLDLLLDGATFYPSFELADQRPTWHFDVTDLIQQDRIHEFTELHPGQFLQLASTRAPDRRRSCLGGGLSPLQEILSAVFVRCAGPCPLLDCNQQFLWRFDANRLKKEAWDF